MLAGYCWPQSALAGHTIEIAISSSVPSCDITVARVGREERVVASFADVAVSEQRIPDQAALQGCGWSSSLNLAVKNSWASGFYLVRIKNSDGATAEAFFSSARRSATGIRLQH